MATYRKPVSVEEQRLMTKIAYLYHKRGYKQSEIAKQLDLSQASVSRTLKRAEEEGIVRVSVTIPTSVYTELEEALCEKYNLKEAIVVHCDDQNDEAVFDHVGSAAAYYIETTLGSNEIGLSSWSSTLLAMVNAMHPLAKASHAKVVQMLGGMGNPSAEIYAARITEQFASLVQGDPVYLPAPGVARSQDAYADVMSDTFVREATAYFDKITLAIVGIGSVEPSKLLQSSGNVFSEEELEALQQTGAVGDVCLRFFDITGQPVNLPLDKRVVSIGLDQLKNVKRIVGVAGGKRKLNAIRGALNGQLINVLITDHQTAQALMN
ncbi:MAG: DNA-binding transcriptional regulator [Anaerolineaceae bacterium]|nr:DNA-binding transcriptional regulator [Anaerolineaceae bacterium]